jgi:spectrin beta
MPNGGEYLFQAKDDEEMNIWINKINTTTKYASASSLSGKGAQGESQTMPAPDTGSIGSMKKDEPKRRSFFTMKKN